jgi:hypothetical protein
MITVSVSGRGKRALPVNPGSSPRGCYLTGDPVSGVLQCCGIGCNDDVGKIPNVVSEEGVRRDGAMDASVGSVSVGEPAGGPGAVSPAVMTLLRKLGVCVVTA